MCNSDTYNVNVGDDMEVNNPLYRKQGIHALSSIFTIDKGVCKVLLVKRSNEPFKDSWALVGGALYNNEDLESGCLREVETKTGIKNIDLVLCNVFGKVNRSPLMRMVAISYLAVIDSNKIKVLKETLKTSNADWFLLDNIPSLAYDHNEILLDAIEKLKEEITRSDILKSLFPSGFTIPELQKTYESILDIKLDRRNFRRKLLNLDLIYDTNKEVNFVGKKKAKLYKFKDKKTKNKSVL